KARPKSPDQPYCWIKEIILHVGFALSRRRGGHNVLAGGASEGVANKILHVCSPPFRRLDDWQMLMPRGSEGQRAAGRADLLGEPAEEKDAGFHRPKLSD